MSENTLDCRGLACPQPVLRCKEAISQSRPDRLVIVVDNQAARQNVTRFLGSQGYTVVHVQNAKDAFELTAEPAQGQSRGQDQPSPQNEPFPKARSPRPQSSDQEAQLVLITSNRIGHGHDELGRKLMHNFIATLPEMGPSLWRILLLNSGVKLAVEGSPVLEELREMEKNEVSILVCGTCLDFFSLLDQKSVGQTTNMLDVVTSLQLADKVITV